MRDHKLDFTAVNNREMSYNDLVANLDIDDLRRLTNGMIDTILKLIITCEDADVVFEPHDPEANDTFATNEAEQNMPWTLGHVIVHTTASSEESAFIAAELARGVPFHGRSRSEVPWQTVTSITQCRQRLEESRRMRLASLEMWPDQPYLDNQYKAFVGEVNAVGSFVLGLYHEDSHLAQISDIVQQAKEARTF